MELSQDFPCENHKCKDTLHDKNGTNCKITCEVSESRRCSQYNSYLCRRDDEKHEKHRAGMSYRVHRNDERANHQIQAGSYMDCSEDEKRIGCSRLGSKSHRHDIRREYHRARKTDYHRRGRSRHREETSDPLNSRRRSGTKSRHSRRSRIRRRRSRSRTTSGSSSGRSHSISLDRYCRKCNSTSKYDHDIKQVENRRKKLSSVCKSHACLERRSTYVTEHSYSQCCPRNLICCCNMHSCNNRKRKHRHYSSESDEGASHRRRNYCSRPEQAQGCHTRVSVCSCYDCKGIPFNDSEFGLHRTDNTKCKEVAPIRGCMKSASSSLYAGHCVQNRDDCDTGSAKAHYERREVSSNVDEKNKLWSSCALENVKFVSGQTETEDYQEQWLKLSLKAPQSSGIKVESIFKNDLKLSLPDFEGEINREGSAPTQINLMGFHSFEKTRRQVGTDGLSADSSCFHSIWSPNVDSSSCPQSKEKIHFLSGTNATRTLPNLNIPEKIIDMDSGTTTNCHYSPTKEPRCTILHQSNLGISAISDNSPVTGHAVPPNQGDDKILHLTKFPYNEKDRILCPEDSHLQAISTSGPSDCGIGANCNAPQGVQFESTKELSGSLIIIADSEDECFEENSLHGLHGKNNLSGSSVNITVQEEISHDNGRNDPSNDIEGGCLQRTLSSGNTLCSDKPESGLECMTASVANARGRDEVVKNVNLGGPSSFQSSENIDNCTVKLEEGKCNIVDLISSEDESADNDACNVVLPFKNVTLQESGGNKLQDCVTSRGPNYITLSEEESFSHKDNEKSQVVDIDNADKGSLRDVRKHKKIDLCPVNASGNVEAACSSEGISSTLDCKHFDRSRVEALIELANSKPRLWDSGIVCDLCGQGRSLIYGEWYAWCCGYRLFYCKCTEDHKRKLKLSMNQKNKKVSKRWDGHQWSGKVHRMCGLWSSEVFEKDDGRDQLEGLVNAVRRGRNVFCKDPDCRRFGATLGCRVKKCQCSFHYPCAVKLASQLSCRMWEGCRRPIACRSHRHVDHDCIDAKDFQSHIKGNYGNKVVSQAKGSMNTATYLEKHSFENMDTPNNVPPRADRNLSVVEEETAEVTAVKNKAGSCALSKRGKTADQICAVNKLENDGKIASRRVQDASTVQYLGKNLICVDISRGMEAVSIPCTNDIDDAPVPSFDYITCNRFSEHADVILKSVLANTVKQAKPCNGCYKIDMDDPEACISVHVDVSDGRRDQDRRIDWQGEPMLGRLPYDRYGLLQLGWFRIDVVECNSRCQCGPNCVNRELQKGLHVELEVFKTEERGWGVRTLEQIPRGKFVLEYVGEMLTEGEVSKRGLVYPEYNSSYLFNLDHPAVPLEDQLVLDGFKMSNVGRFINHSCEGNLSIYRVYTETLDKRIFRIGLYAGRDIEIGEELTYDYKYIQEPGVPVDDPGAFKCFCRAKSCRQISLSSDA